MTGCITKESGTYDSKGISNKRSKETVCKVRGLSHFHQDIEFNFWHSFFHRIMHHVDILIQQTSSKTLSIMMWLMIDGGNFVAYSSTFLNKLLYITYPVLNKKRLKTKLSDFVQIHGNLWLLNFIMNNIEDTFHEVTILLCLLFTTPMITAEAKLFQL
ncbi:hypothetical protein PR048_016030 [Dryococelus australis]|uniref:Uncharacterized protein n=1 Tax=Dryococelus australis TaxID=614101 RepID=A0ABQ9HIL6_9NEOP|nr:hypothetical protein PR048_016030 [Dryococelus australis]